MSATKLEELLTMVGPLISRKQAIREPISAKERLCITLRFLASGDSMHSLHYAYLIGTSNVGTIIAETCKAIFTALEPKVLYSELTTNDWYRIVQDFEDKWDFPHTIGAIDGKHIMFECPDKTGSLYYNYKGYHSLIFLGVCDADYMFTLVEIGSYGRCSDGGVFKRSAFGKKFEKFSMNVPPPSKISRKRMPLPYCLIGDQAFPLKPYLLSPYPKDIHYTRMKRIYNYRLSRARRMIENCFNILASRWRIFRRPFSTTDPTATEVIKAAVCLHNWLRRHDITKKPKILYIEPELIDREDGKFSIVEGKWRKIVENDTGLVNLKKLNTKDKVDYCTDMRDEFCEYFNYEGKVDFQDLCA